MKQGQWIDTTDVESAEDKVVRIVDKKKNTETKTMGKKNCYRKESTFLFVKYCPSDAHASEEENRTEQNEREGGTSC